MGMNYYLRSKECSKCGHRKTELHIGKSSCGWQFHFRGYSDQSIVSYEDWLKEFDDESKEIVNEEGEIFSIDEFIELVESKESGFNHYNIVFGRPQTKAEIEYAKERQSMGRCILNSDSRSTWKDNNGHTFSEQEFS